MKRNLPGRGFFAVCLLLSFSSFGGNSRNPFKLPAAITANDYMAQTIIVKVKPEFRAIITETSVADAAVRAAFDELQVSSFKKRFPHTLPPQSDYNSWGAKMVDLTTVYE